MLKRKVLPLLLVVSILLGISGCNMVQIDPEKDMARTVAKIEGEKVLKREFAKLYAYYEMTYHLNGYELPTDEEELGTLKEDLLDSLVEIELLKREAIKDGVEIDEEASAEEGDSTVETLKSGFETEEKYVAFIEDRNLTREEFEEFIKDYVTGVYYANNYLLDAQDELFESGEEAGTTVVTVDGDNLTKDEFYYYLSKMEMFYYSNYGQGLPSDETSLNTIYNQIQDQIVESYLVRKDGQEKGIELEDDEVDKTAEEIRSNYTSIFGDEMSEYLKSYYISEDRFDEFIALDAKTQLYEEALREEFENDTTITDKEIEEYYEENKDSYDESTVSAKHILTASEEFAKQLSEEITDAESFEEAFEKYGDDENVSEAADLGEFGRGEMVQEFEDAAFSMNKGEVSEPVKTQYGYHIIYVYDKSEVEIPSLDEKKSEIKENLMNEKVTTKITQYKSDLTSSAEVKKEIVQEPFEHIIDDLKGIYEVETYPDVL